MPKHFAVVAPPAHGHVNPTLPLVEELVRRGHRVSYATGPDLIPAVETAGAHGVRLPSELPQFMPSRGDFSGENFAEMLTHFLADARKCYPIMREHFANDLPDAVCYDMMTFTGRMLAESLDVPGVALVPNFAENEQFSLRDEFMPANFDPESPALMDFNRQMQEFAAEHGVTVDGGVMDGRGVADLNLVCLPKDFQLAADTFDDRFRFIGPMFGDRAHSEPWQPADPDTPLLFISLGTAFNRDAEFYRTCFEAFRDSSFQVALAIGHRVDIAELGDIPANFDVRAHFPQLAVLRHAAVFLSHTGMNSTMESLSYGVPLVAVPQMPEQEANARRVEELGLGHRLDPDTLTAETLRQTVDEVAASDEIRANLAEFQQVINKCGGEVAGADAIEAHLA